MADAPETLDMEVLCMQMIVDAGSAKSDYMEALQAVKAGDYETAAAKMKSGDEQYAAGHEQHAKLVQQEAAGDPVTMSLLLISNLVGSDDQKKQKRVERKHKRRQAQTEENG